MSYLERRWIGPEEAGQILAHNNNQNRKISPALVQRYATDMADGRWIFTGDPIQIAMDGALLNGQHRLLAVVRSGTKQEFLFVYDLPLHTQTVMDTGRRRTLGDVLSIQGLPNANLTASALNYLWGWEAEVDFAVGSSNWRPSVPQALECLKRHPGLVDSCRPGKNLANHHLKIAPSLCVFRHYQFGQIDEEDRDDFWDRIINRRFDGEFDPLQQLVFKLLQDSANPQSRLPTTHKHALFVKAWNYYREGTPVKIIKWSRGGRNREPFPVAI